MQQAISELIPWFDEHIVYVTSERAQRNTVAYFKAGQTIKDDKSTYVGTEQGKIALLALYNQERARSAS